MFSSFSIDTGKMHDSLVLETPTTVSTIVSARCGFQAMRPVPPTGSYFFEVELLANHGTFHSVCLLSFFSSE